MAGHIKQNPVTTLIYTLLIFTQYPEFLLKAVTS